MSPLLSLSFEFKEALFRHISEQGFIVENVHLLDGGRSNYVWRAGDIVIKLYDKNPQNPLFANDPDREITLLRELAGEEIAPDVLGHGTFRGTRWLTYRHINGQTWTHDTPAVARILGKVHAHTFSQKLPLGDNGSQELKDTIRQLLSLCAPSKESRNISQAINQLPTIKPIAEPRLIHADPVPGNLITDTQNPILIDWQCPVLGDPAEDLAIFLSPAMQFTYRGRMLSHAETHDFLSAYPNPKFVERYIKLRPWYHLRMATYCLWRSEIRAAQYEISAFHAI